MCSVQLNPFGVLFSRRKKRQQLLIDFDFTQTDTKNWMLASVCVLCERYVCDRYLSFYLYILRFFYAATAKPI